MSTRSAAGDRDPYIVRPLARALDVLSMVGRNPDGISLAELATQSDLPKSTVFRYLRTFREAHFVAHDAPSDRYRLGHAIWRLNYQSGAHRHVQRVVLPAMHALVERFDETVNFGVMDGEHVHYLEIIECSRSLRMQAAVGRRDPLHATALGKALLAAMPDDSWRQVLPPRLPAATGATVRTRRELAVEIAHIRQTGFAVERGENEEGASCVASAILAPDGTALGALSLSAPAIRMPSEVEAAVGVALRAATKRCTSVLFASTMQATG